MSTKPETRFYTAIHKLLPKSLYREKMNNPFRGGTADVWYSGTADDLWVEYKFLIKVPKKASINVSATLSPLQIQWLGDRADEGRNIVVVLGTTGKSWIFENRAWENELVPPTTLHEQGLTRAQVAGYITKRTMLDEHTKVAVNSC